jgi:type IV secretory pathway TraG/TraD family ATPase VirD4
MSSGWWKLARGTWKVSNAAGNLAHSSSVNALNNRVSRGARRGILGPWDAAPPPRAMQTGLWDYRGVARLSDIARAPADFPLGRYREPRRWSTKHEFGLPEAIANEHTIVLGPTRSGKTASIIAPWVHRALGLGCSVVAVDVKGGDDLLAEIKRYSTFSGPLGVPVIKWDYTDPARSASWDWAGDLATESEINAAVEAICGRPSASDPNKFFHQSAIKYLRGLLQIASTLPSALTLTDILDLLSDQTGLESLVMARRGQPGAQRLIELTGLSAGDFMKYTMELKTHLETLDTSGFAAVTRRRQFSFDLLRDQSPVLVIVVAPVADGALADAACSLFLGQFLQRVLSGFGTVARPTLLALDEAARVQERIDLGSTLSLVAGAGVSVLLATQDVSQFKEDRRDEILANCGTMICLPRVSRATTEYMAGRLGDMYFASMSNSTSTDPRGVPSRSWTQAGEKGPVLGHREIASPHPALGEWPGIVHAPSLSSRPIIVDLTRADLTS